MNIYLFGNLLEASDSLALELQNYLENNFPDSKIIHADPTGDFIPENGSIIIDTIIGIDKIMVFDNIENFARSPRISVHDYDLALHLKLLKKLKKIRNIKIIGLPRRKNKKQIKKKLKSVISLVNSNLPSESV